jgi:2-aminoadipate transaminase
MKFNESYFADHMRPLTGSAIREIFKLLAKPGMISFAGGNPSMSALEPDVISDIAREVLAKHGATLQQYGATDGFGPLMDNRSQEFNRLLGWGPNYIKEGAEYQMVSENWMADTGMMEVFQKHMK